MRRVKKTTNEQFELLKAEMSLHPAAARGYGVGAQRAVVDAEWKDIVEKLNALGPPERTMTEWKKVWSDLRLRSIKRISEEFTSTPKPKKAKYKSKKSKLIETLFSSDSIYASYGENSQQNYLSPTCSHDVPPKHDVKEQPYANPLAEGELHNTEKLFYSSSHDANSYDINSLEEEDTADMYHNKGNNYNSNHAAPHNAAVLDKFNEEKLKYLGHTISTIGKQLENQNKFMEHLTKMSSNLENLMQRRVIILEKQNTIRERQLRANEYHNMFFRRHETKRNVLVNKCKVNSHKY